MAITSTMAYIINEEVDGFVAVNFDIINDEHQDISSWELIDQSLDEDCSIGENTDRWSESEDEEVDFTGFPHSDVSPEYSVERIDGEDLKSPFGISPDYSAKSIIDQSSAEDCSNGESTDGLSENEEKEVEFTLSLPSVVSSAYLTEKIDGEDLNLIPQSSPDYHADSIIRHNQFTVGDDDVMTYRYGSEKYYEEDDREEEEDGEDLNLIPESSPDYHADSIIRHNQFTVGDDDVMTYRYGSEKYYEEDDREEEEEECDYDLDDELIPYYVNCKFGRERMRKLGKRPCPKSIKTKRLTYNYNKAGCFRGKRGLGLKHSLI